jgi:putative membrane protein
MKTIATCIATAVVAVSGAAVWAAGQAEGLNDAQIAQIMISTDRIEVEAGKLAASKAQNPDVRAYAQRMVTEHSANNQSATALIQKLHLTPQPDAFSQKLDKEGADSVAHLGTLQGAKFDRNYIDQEVYFHKAVAEQLGKRMVPAAKNPDLKALLEKEQPQVQSHLEEAERIAKEAEKSG